MDFNQPYYFWLFVSFLLFLFLFLYSICCINMFHYSTCSCIVLISHTVSYYLSSRSLRDTNKYPWLTTFYLKLVPFPFGRYDENLREITHLTQFFMLLFTWITIICIIKPQKTYCQWTSIQSLLSAPNPSFFACFLILKLHPLNISLFCLEQC